jgi:hypothetical protein
MNSLIEQIEAWLTQLIDKRVSEQLGVNQKSWRSPEAQVQAVVREQLDDSLLMERAVAKQLTASPLVETIVKEQIEEQLGNQGGGFKNPINLLIDKDGEFTAETRKQIEEIATDCIETYAYDDIIDDRLYAKEYVDQDDVESVCKTIIKELDIRLHIE